MQEEQHFTMKEISPLERPYERLLHVGTDGLSDAELLAIVLRSGRSGETVLDMSRRILSTFAESTDSPLHQLLNLNETQLQEFAGIGEVKAILLRAVGEIARRYQVNMTVKRPFMKDPGQVADYFMARMQGLEKEEVHVLSLNNRCQLLHDSKLTIGSVNQTILEPRELFIEAMKHGAVSVILVHNHPSGNPDPSKADILTTKGTVECGQMLGISVLDHVIIGKNEYYSMKEHNDI